jgi:hypothetical protein
MGDQHRDRKHKRKRPEVPRKAGSAGNGTIETDGHQTYQLVGSDASNASAANDFSSARFV